MSRLFFSRLNRRFGRPMTGVERRALVERGLARHRRLMAVAVEESPLSGKSVAVIGGGFAGLAAGLQARRLGAEVTVFEARPEVGGRVWSDSDGVVPGRVIEKGAELVGAIHGHWIGFAQELGLGLSVLTPDSDYETFRLEAPLFLLGRHVPGAEQEALFHEMEALTASLDHDAHGLNPAAPWTSQWAAQWDAMTVDDWLRREAPSPFCEAAFRTMLENDNTVELSRQSYLSLLAQVAAGGFASDGRGFFWTDAENYRCESGNQSLARGLRDRLRSEGGVVREGTAVARVDLGGGAVWLMVGGQTLRHDFAVLAVPPSVWGTEIEISPDPRPTHGVQMGDAVKYLSSVGERFWIGESLAPAGMSDQLGETWEGTDNQMVVEGQGIGLSLFAGGPDATNALDYARGHHGEVKGWFDPRMDTLFPGYSARVRNAFFVDWPNAPFIRTGYACPAPGQVTGRQQALNALWHGQVAFAGEHVSPGFFGYMEGALESGVNAALRLAGSLSTIDVSAAIATLYQDAAAG